MAKSKFELSFEDGIHKKISDLVGEWSGQTKTWFEKDLLADESPIKAKITSILNGRFIASDYNGSLEGKPLEGKMIIGFDLPYQRFTVSLVDSFPYGNSNYAFEWAGNNKWVFCSRLLR